MSFALTLAKRLARLSRRQKRALMVAADLLALPLALWSAYALHLADAWPYSYLQAYGWLFIATPLAGVLVFQRLGLYRAVVHHLGPPLLWSVVKGTLLLAVLMLAAAYLGRWQGFPHSVPIIFALVALVYVAGTRLLVYELYRRRQASQGDRQAVVIYGAGEAGAQLARALVPDHAFRLVALVDDDPALWGSTVQGVRVYPPEQLGKLIERQAVRRVLLALPSASRAQRHSVLERLTGLPVHVQSIPPLNEIVSGQASLDQLRELELEDLLGRMPVAPLPEMLTASVAGHSVMVTGAGGSIGSELCRQLLPLAPARLVLFEMGEYALYAVERELEGLQARGIGAGVELVALLGNVCDRRRVETVIATHNIETLYHAAAYKHLPIVERNVLEGVHNNVHGTRVVAESAARHGVGRCLLISTDKAVRPASVMGATKRTAEMLLQDLARDVAGSGEPGTLFAMVRFGNVLGSSGSVVPLFRRQIDSGGPVTVTHPEVTRYFMTLAEAALLVIQAGAMARGGDLFVLDMGEPVKVADLARRMIQLSAPQQPIRIEFTGLRPGEKLHEELLIGDRVSPTAHPRIRRAEEAALPHAQLMALLNELYDAERRLDAEHARSLLRQLTG